MDKPLASDHIRKDSRKKWLRMALILLALASAVYGVNYLLKRKAIRKDFHIARVERGGMLNTLTASGIVVAAFEREINAPVETEIEKVLKTTGDVVQSNDIILILDEEYTRLAYDQLNDELLLKRNNVDKLKLEYDKNLLDLGYRDQIKALQLDELRAEVIDQKRLKEVGGTTAEDVEKAQLLLKIAELEKKQLENELEYRRSVNVNEKKGLELEYTIQEKKLQELSRKLRETKVRAPHAGVITWINEDIGRKVSAGEPLVRLANLNRFRVEASASDRNTGQINVGMPVEIRINAINLRGYISSVLPEVVNNTVKFLVELDDAENAILRPNMRAEVYIITDKKDDVLRVKNGSAFKGASSQDIFVVEGDKAIKRRIGKGLVNSDYVEITQNLKEGEQVIISSTEDFDHLDEFIIKEK